MKRTFLGIIFRKVGFAQFNNDLVEEIVEGIQDRGGDIINISVTPVLDSGRGERLLILYEDNGYYSVIKSFLKPFLIIESPGVKNELY